MRGLEFVKLQAMWERITAPVSGFSLPRIDYVMRRRKREGMMEIAFASASHSSYWVSEDVVLFTIMQICRPVIDKLHRYMSARRPLPRLVRDAADLTPETRVVLSSKALIRERCTGLSHERVVLLDQDGRLYMLPKSDDVACRRKWKLTLTPTSKAVYGDDSFTFKVIANDRGTTSAAAASSSGVAASPQQQRSRASFSATTSHSSSSSPPLTSARPAPSLLSAQSASIFRSAKAISGSIIQNSARWRLVFEFSARKVGPNV